MSDALSCPKWRSHKIVHADKITGFQFPPNADGPVIRLGCGAAFTLDEKAWKRINGMVTPPEGEDAWPLLVGGYFVHYEDGYQSWSPANVFEAGYTRIE